MKNKTTPVRNLSLLIFNKLEFIYLIVQNVYRIYSNTFDTLYLFVYQNLIDTF